MREKFYGIFVAGGSGSRMGGDIPKQFMRIGGKTILQHTIEKFVEAVPEIEVITVLPAAHMEAWKEICTGGSMTRPQILVAGGITRFHSVKNALARVPDGAVVAIHDGVRPMASVALVRGMLDRMDSCRALVPVIPVVDTLRNREPGNPAPDRDGLVAVQTPQFFLSEEIKAAYGQPYDTGFTDDSSVAEKAGIPVSFFPGEKYNFKITTPEDLDVARLILCSSCNP